MFNVTVTGPVTVTVTGPGGSLEGLVQQLIALQEEANGLLTQLVGGLTSTPPALEE